MLKESLVGLKRAWEGWLVGRLRKEWTQLLLWERSENGLGWENRWPWFYLHTDHLGWKSLVWMHPYDPCDLLKIVCAYVFHDPCACGHHSGRMNVHMDAYCTWIWHLVKEVLWSLQNFCTQQCKNVALSLQHSYNLLHRDVHSCLWFSHMLLCRDVHSSFWLSHMILYMDFPSSIWLFHMLLCKDVHSFLWLSHMLLCKDVCSSLLHCHNL